MLVYTIKTYLKISKYLVTLLTTPLCISLPPSEFKFFLPEVVGPVAATAAAKSLQSCPTLCDPIDGSPPGSTVPEILQARTLEWVAASFSNA